MSNRQLTLSDKIERIVNEAVEHLQSQLRMELYYADTHQCLIVSGWNDSEANREAIAKYLVGLRAAAVDAALRIRADLFDNNSEGILDLVKCIEKIIGTPLAVLTQHQIEKLRNPWIAEGIWHLCMYLSTLVEDLDLHPPGRIHALDLAHVNPKDHGMDGLALYLSPKGNLGLTIIESKAYKNRPNDAIKAAVKFFRDVEKNEYSDRIRHHVLYLRQFLPQDLQEKVTGMFWNRTRCFIPNPHYDSSVTINWNTEFSFIREYLTIPKDNIIIMPNIIDNFDAFFEDIANKMRTIVGRL